jgi:hypothetical protein
MAAKRFKFWFLLCLIWLGTAALVHGRTPMTWTDKTGKHKVEAEFVKLDGTTLVLKRTDGKVIELSITNLDAASQNQARQAAREALLEKPAAPAASGSNAPVIKFPANATAKEFVDLVIAEVKKKNNLVYWDALPASYQKDVEEVANLAISKVDPAIFVQIENVGKRAIKVLRTKKEMVLATPMVQQVPGDVQLPRIYDPAVDLLEAYVVSDFLKPQRIKEGRIRDLLGNYMRNANAKMEQLIAVLPADLPFRDQFAVGIPEGFRYELEEIGSKASLKLLYREQPPVPMVLVQEQGRWLPEQLVENWSAQVKQIKAQIQNVTPEQMAQAKQQVGAVIGLTINPVIGQLENASSQAEFDEAINNIAETVKGLTSMIRPPGIGAPIQP